VNYLIPSKQPDATQGDLKMARLVYCYFTSLDGHVADEKGKFDWAEPDEAVLEFVNELERPIRTHLYGRRMYETMTCWETDSQFAAQSPGCAAFSEIWKAAEKVVYSTTLSAPSTVQTRVERTFDSDAVRRLKLDASTDISVGGATLAAKALKAGLVDEIRVFISPVVVGGGLKMFPDGVSLQLEFLEERTFKNGMTFVRYSVRQT
jgi:dihydrofolate reductase